MVVFEEGKFTMNIEGKHLIADIWLRENVEWIELKNIISHCLLKHNQLILGFQEWKFYPQGESGVFLIATSHCGIHTYPEHKYMTLDIYSCDKEFNAKGFLDFFRSFVSCAEVRTRIIRRGVKDESI